MVTLKAAVIVVAFATAACAPALASAAVAPITNPAGSYEPVYPTSQTPAGGTATEPQMRTHGMHIPQHCTPTAGNPC